MLIWRAGGAPPAGPGIWTSVFTAIRFHSVTALPAGSPWAGGERPLSTTTSVTAAAIETRMDFITPLSAPTRGLDAYGLLGGTSPPSRVRGRGVRTTL